MKRSSCLALAAIVVAVFLADVSAASAQAVTPPMSSGRHPSHVPPTREELASLGCLTIGTAAVVVVGTAGITVVALTGGGAAAYSNLALPVLGTAFAAGCGVGVLAGPGAAWLIDHFEHLVAPPQ